VVFKTTAIDHSAIPPHRHSIRYRDSTHLLRALGRVAMLVAEMPSRCDVRRERHSAISPAMSD
jgi:hypothetical protein